MNPNPETTLEKVAILDDIEKRVSEIFSAQKSEVEQSLVERINREKEEAQRRIEAVNQEFAQVRKVLEEHKDVMAGLQTTEEHLRGEIRGHFERAVNFQKMMENAAVLAGDELEKIGGLNEDLGKVREKADTEYASLKTQLSSYAGIIPSLPAPAAWAETDLDWNEEISKLRRVRDLLATLRQAEFPGVKDAFAADAPAGAEPSAPAAEAAVDLAASLGLIDLTEDGGNKDAARPENAPAQAAAPDGCDIDMPEAMAEPDAATCEASAVEVPNGPQSEAAPADPPAVDAPAAAPVDESAVLEALARYRKTEPVNNGIEVAYYAAEIGTFLDADAFMAAVAKIVEAAQHHHFQLTQTSSVKDLFLLKQEILNQQEILRKVFFRVVRFSEKEGGHLPESLNEVLGAQGMKGIIERLTMANWSDPSDFKPFQTELSALKRAFDTRTAASPRYLQSVLDEVEGRNS